MLRRVMQAAPWVRTKMEKEMEAGSWRGKAKEDPKGGGRAAPNVLAQYREDTMRTTGEPPSELSPCAARDHRQETPQRPHGCSDAAATRDGKGQRSVRACRQYGKCPVAASAWEMPRPLLLQARPRGL